MPVRALCRALAGGARFGVGNSRRLRYHDFFLHCGVQARRLRAQSTMR